MKHSAKKSHKKESEMHEHHQKAHKTTAHDREMDKKNLMKARKSHSRGK